MVRALRAHASVVNGWRLLAPILALLLLFSIDGVVPSPVAAGSSSSITAVRQRQTKAEATMRRADKQIKRLKQQRKHHGVRLAKAKRKLDQTIARRGKARVKAERLAERHERARLVLARKLRVHPNPKGIQIADLPKLRKKVRKLKAKSAQQERKVRRATRLVEKARDLKQARLKKAGKARIRARKVARERAEDKLGDLISQMLATSQARSGSRFSTASTRTFRKPAKGVISQGYGCHQTHKTKGGRRVCTRFHDGIDIAAPRGTRVRASADGYVAYVGWNPWDQGKRAYVVIIGHGRDYETIYAHLKPVRKIRAGQKVKRGQVIGVVGMTGRTTGPHVHWEVSRNWQTQNPLRAGR